MYRVRSVHHSHASVEGGLVTHVPEDLYKIDVDVRVQAVCVVSSLNNKLHFPHTVVLKRNS